MNFTKKTVSADADSVLLFLDLIGDLPQEIRFDEKEFVLKDEFHITVLGRSHGISEALEKGAVLKGTPFWKAIENLREEKIEVGSCVEFRHVVKTYTKEPAHTRESIIVMCHVPALDAFYKKVQKHLGIQISTVPQHVTLYTTDTPESRRGIGIPNHDDLELYSKVICLSKLPQELLAWTVN